MTNKRTEDLSKASSNTPTALSSIDEIRDILRQFRHDDHKVNLGLHTKKDADELLENFAQHLEAHIAEHYVPKAEVKELDEILTDNFDMGFIAMDTTQAKQQVEALIQDAVTRARIDELENRLRVQFISSHWERLRSETNSWAKYVDRRIAELKATLNTKEIIDA